MGEEKGEAEAADFKAEEAAVFGWFRRPQRKRQRK